MPGCRAAELFDWLRGLPEGHELAHLCDVYTYTTLISQCGSHQQLRKANIFFTFWTTSYEYKIKGGDCNCTCESTVCVAISTASVIRDK